MAPIILIALAGGAAFMLLKKGESTSGDAPIFSGGFQQATVKATSGFIYKTAQYPVDSNGNLKVTATAVGFSQGPNTTALPPGSTMWVAYSQNQASGKRALISRGKQATTQTLKDFGLA